jgi:hypothetical protein
VIDASRNSLRRLRARRHNHSSGYGDTGGCGSGRRSGRWVRRGNKIIIFGI